ncbi:MAG: ABC transporter ATP-binding protein [Clostridia bacterium]|nr:ABC transporter ATP-binding protein [Clostridia bacterium]MBR2389110.1 ABC transporter ATP-binding protein [Clostridia bacterium]
MSETLLKVENLEVYYGVIRALKGISFEVKKGEIVSLIGANGAGKTTTLHTITGLIRPKNGSVFYKGKDITKTPAHKIVSEGLVHVPEGRRIFQSLSVYDNLLMGAYTRKDKSGIEETMQEVFRDFPRLEERKKQLAGTLSGGEQQMLAMGRALLADPELIVLDEPSMGLSPLLVSEIFEIVKSFKEAGKTVLLVEQNAKKAMSISDRVYVLETGSITMSGDASELINDPSIKKAYLGEA